LKFKENKLPVFNFAIPVGTAVTQIASPSNGPNKYVYIQNADYEGDTEIYVGDENVTTDSGMRVWRDQQMVFEINGDDSMFAIASGTASAVRVIEIR
jgi:hypothetical protein